MGGVDFESGVDQMKLVLMLRVRRVGMEKF